MQKIAFKVVNQIHCRRRRNRFVLTLSKGLLWRIDEPDTKLESVNHKERTALSNACRYISGHFCSWCWYIYGVNWQNIFMQHVLHVIIASSFWPVPCIVGYCCKYSRATVVLWSRVANHKWAKWLYILCWKILKTKQDFTVHPILHSNSLQALASYSEFMLLNTL